MRGIGVALKAILLAATGGCTHITANTSQFYLAQDYLPLPPAVHTLPYKDVSNGCAGAVLTRHRKPSKRYTAQVLPGMTLHVSQTSYAATRADEAARCLRTGAGLFLRVPIPNQARRAPTASAPSPLGRSDLLHVRNLLSGAQLIRDAPADARPSTYFAEAMAQACASASGIGASLSCAEKPFLDIFVAGLAFNIRAQTKLEAGDAKPQPQPGPPFEIEVPLDVGAATGAPEKAEDRGYGRWYAGLSGFRFPADLFLGGLQAERCRGPFSNDTLTGEDTRAQDAPVCKFAQTSLEWSDMDGTRQMPGKTLSAIQRLSLPPLGRSLAALPAARLYRPARSRERQAL